MSHVQADIQSIDASPLQAGQHTLGLRAGLLLVIFALIVLLPGIHVSFTDRDEGNYAQVCRTMLETGDWLVPRHHGQPWLDKPPLLYWLATASFKLLGMGEWQARLVSVLASTANVLLTGLLGAWMFGRRVGLIAGLLLATCGMFAIVGRMLLMDPILLTCILAAVALHWHIADRSGQGSGFSVQQRAAGFSPRGGDMSAIGLQALQSAIRNAQSAIHYLAAAYWLAIGLGVLAKGPTVLLFTAGFALALTRLPGGMKRWGGWRFWIWMPLAVLVAAPWYVAMSRQAGAAMKEQFLLFGIVSRVVGTPDGHWGPPGYHLAHSLVTLLPWTVFVPTAIAAAIRERRSDPQLRLVLVWLAVPWLIVELMRSKLPHYVLPCYVPLMILVARQWDAALTSRKWPSASWAERWVPAVWALVMIGLGAALMVGGETWRMTLWGRPVAGLGVVMAGGFAVAGGLLRRHRVFPALISSLVTGTIFFIAAGCRLAPAIEPLRLSRNLATAINQTTRPGDDVLLCGYDEPSTFYYIRAVARPARPDEVASRLRDSQTPFVLADVGGQASRPPSGSPQEPGRPVHGFDYVKSQWVTLEVTRHTGHESGGSHD